MNLLEPALTNFFRHKKIFLYIFSISIFFGIIIALFYSLYEINNIFSNKIKNNIINRVITISKDDTSSFNTDEEKNISNIENVSYIYKRIVPVNMTVNNENSFLISYVSKEELPLLKYGNTFDNLNIPEIIIPRKMQNIKMDYDNQEECIDKYLMLSVDDFNINAKVQGIYDSENYENTIYVNDFFKDKLINYNNETENDRILYAIVDNYSNVKTVISKLKDNGYDSALYSTLGLYDIKIYDTAKILIIAILFVSIIFIYIVLSIIICAIINDEKMDIAIFKAIGYKVRDISKIIMYRISLILIFSIILGSILSIAIEELIFFVLIKKLDVLINNDVKLYIFVILIFTMAVYLISYIAIIINSKKIKKVNTIELLKEN